MVDRIDMKIKVLDNGISKPCYAKSGDAGLDLRSTIDAVIEPGCRVLSPTGVSVASPEGYAGFVQPRSGLALKHGLTIVNTPGLIDSGYRGELGVIALNTDKSDSFVVNRGDRIAQLVVQAVPVVNLIEVEELDETERGGTGFGSSGL